MGSSNEGSFEVRIVSKRVRSKILSMGELNYYDSSTSEVHVMTFDEERGDRSSYGAFSDVVAQQRGLVAPPSVGPRLNKR